MSVFNIGDLVKDTDPHFNSGLGIVVEIDHGEGMYKIQFAKASEWLTEMFLELISESR